MSSIQVTLVVVALACVACTPSYALATTASTPETAGLVKFNASKFDGGAAPGSIIFSAVLDNATDTIAWNFTFPKGYKGLYALEIRDGKAGSDVMGVELFVPSPAPVAATGKQTLNGSFGAAEISPAVAGSARELANHMCMGHIYAVVQVESGAQRAAIGYSNPTDSNACYEAIGLDPSQGMGDMGMDMGGMDNADGADAMDDMPGMTGSPAVSPSPRPSSPSPSPAPPTSGAVSLAVGLATGVAAAVAVAM